MDQGEPRNATRPDRGDGAQARGSGDPRVVRCMVSSRSWRIASGPFLKPVYYLLLTGLGSSLSSMPLLDRRVTMAHSLHAPHSRPSSPGNSISSRVFSGKDSGSTQTKSREGARPRARHRALRRPSLWSRISAPVAAREQMKGSCSAGFLRKPEPGATWNRVLVSSACGAIVRVCLGLI